MSSMKNVCLHEVVLYKKCICLSADCLEAYIFTDTEMWFSGGHPEKVYILVYMDN